LLSKDISSKP